ncbi:MAG: class I SAM-dependent methyltransferase [Pseudomonadota bacterium]
MTNNQQNLTNYDACSADYDNRYTAGPTGVAEILQSLAEKTMARAVLEAGCGTGHWLDQLQGIPEKFGLDLSQGMLMQAGKKGAGMNLVRGEATRLPFLPRSFDFIYCIHAVQHFSSPSLFIKEVHRLLRPGGALAIIGMDPHGNRGHWYVYDYFAGTYEADLLRYPSADNLAKVMQEEGMERCALMQGASLQYDFRGKEVFADPVLHKNGVSQLALLSEEDFARGMERIRAAIATGGETGEEIIFPARISLPAVVGFAPPL